MSRGPAFYADPALYDLVHASGTDDEVWLLDRLAALYGNGERAVLRVGDMRSYRTKRKFGLVFNLLSTFRHLPSDKDALAHLRRCADSLMPGGVMVLGLDLAWYGHEQPDEEVFVERGATHVMMTLPADRKKRRERIMNFVNVPGRKPLESHYDLRSYDAKELKALLAKSPFMVKAVFSYAGKPAKLGGPERALWLVLSKK